MIDRITEQPFCQTRVSGSTVYLMDCIALMKEYPDKYFDLAVVDPPYGINADVKNSTDKKQSKKSASNSKKYGEQNGMPMCQPKSILSNFLEYQKSKLFGV